MTPPTAHPPDSGSSAQDSTAITSTQALIMPHPTYSRIGPTGKIAFTNLDTVKKVWRFTLAEIEAHENYFGPMALKIVAKVMHKGGDIDQYTLFVKATPTQWRQFEEGRDAHIAAVRARTHTVAVLEEFFAPPAAAEEDPK